MAQVQVYRSSKLKGALVVAACAVVAALGAVVLEERPLLGWTLIVLFVAGGLAALAAVVAGGTTLSLGRKGFELSSLFTHQRIRWDDIEPPALVDIRKARVIGVSYKPGRGKSGVSRVLLGVDLSIPNAFGVPLQALCDRMNECRTRAVAAGLGADSVPAAPAAETAATAAGRTTPVRPYHIALGAALLVLVLNVLGRLVLKLEGMPVTMGMAFGVGALVAWWFGRTVGRPPTAPERVRFLAAYGAMIALPMLALFCAAAASRGFNGFGLLILALHAVAYPAAAQVCLADKRLAALVPKRA
jgi:hypothetical protein